MDFTGLINIAKSTFLPRKSMSELTKDESYMITALKWVTTRFGKRIVVEIDQEFQVFLPKRIADALEKNEKMYDDMMAKANKMSLFLKYLGDNKFEFVCT